MYDFVLSLVLLDFLRKSAFYLLNYVFITYIFQKKMILSEVLGIFSILVSTYFKLIHNKPDFTSTAIAFVYKNKKRIVTLFYYYSFYLLFFSNANNINVFIYFCSLFDKLFIFQNNYN